MTANRKYRQRALQWLGASALIALLSPHASIAQSGLPPAPFLIAEPTRGSDGRLAPMTTEIVEASRECTASVERPGVVEIRNSASNDRPKNPVTFGMTFGRGLVPESVGVEGHSFQVDEKRRWPDGSLKHAVVTASLPTIPAKEKLQLQFVGARSGTTPANGLAADAVVAKLPEVSVHFAIHGGPKLSSLLSNAVPQSVSQSKGSAWLSGPHVTEHILADVPKDQAGLPDPDLEVRYHVRHYPQVGTTRVAVIVENIKWTSPGGIPYDVLVEIDGETAFEHSNVGRWPKEKEYVGHSKGTRWIKRFWIGGSLGDTDVLYDLPCLFTTGLLPRYDPTQRINRKVLDKYWDNWVQRAPTDILQRGFLNAYFPGTGGRDEIAPLPVWTSRYLLSQDVRLRKITLAHGDISGGIPIHYRDPESGGIVSIDTYPGFSLNPNATYMKMPVREANSTPWILKKKTKFVPDAAHQGSFAYVPYLITGDYYYLEEMIYWANYNMLRIHPRKRKGVKGLIWANQTRGVAWVLRNHVHAAALAPDDNPARDYLEPRLDHWMSTSEEFALDPKRPPMGHWRSTSAYTANWKRKYRWRFLSLPLWMNNFLVWSLSHAIDHGYEGFRPFLERLAGFSIGMVNNPEQITPHAASSYFIIVGEKRDGVVHWAKTWKDIDYLTYDAPVDENRKRPTKSRGNYANILRGALLSAAHAGVPGAPKAYDWIDRELRPGLTNWLRKDPTWAFTPPPRESEADGG